MVNFQGQSLEQLANSLRSVLEGVPTRCRNSSRFTRAVLEIRAFCEGLMDLVKRNHNDLSGISMSDQERFTNLLVQLLSLSELCTPWTADTVVSFSVSLGKVAGEDMESLLTQIVQLRLKAQRLISPSVFTETPKHNYIEIPSVNESPAGRLKRKRALESHYKETRESCEILFCSLCRQTNRSHPPVRTPFQQHSPNNIVIKAFNNLSLHEPTSSNTPQANSVSVRQGQTQTFDVTANSLKHEACHGNHTAPDPKFSFLLLNRQTPIDTKASQSMLRYAAECIPTVPQKSNGDFIVEDGNGGEWTPDAVRPVIGSRNSEWLRGFLGNELDFENLSRRINTLSVRTSSLDATALHSILHHNVFAQREFGPTISTILSWVYNAMRPLTMSELQEVVSVHQGDTVFQPNAVLEPQAILNLCQGLITCDETNNIVTFANPHIRDLLRSNDLLSADYLADTLVTYLSFDCFRYPCSDYRSLSNRLSKYKFANYAATYWPYYLKACNPDSVAVEKAFNLFRSRGRRTAILQMQCDEGGQSSGYCIQNRSALHLYAQYGLANLCQRVLVESASTLDDVLHCLDGEKRTPLHLAAMFGHLDVVELLLSEGADSLKSEARGMTPLHFASQNGHVDVVNALLLAQSQQAAAHHHEVVPPVRRWTPSPIDLAKKQGHTEVVEALSQNQREMQFENPMQDYMLALWSQENLNRGKFRMAKINDTLPHYAKLPYWQDVRQFGVESAHRLLLNYEARIEIWDGALPRIDS